MYRKGPETKRLIHRAFEVDDAESFFTLNSHPQVMRLTGEDMLSSLTQAREALRNYPDFETVGFGRWACILKETQTIIGFCGLKYLPELDEVDIGYRFLPEFWGQGLATEACTACLRFGFDTLQLGAIIGLVIPENQASIRVLEKVGMNLEGPLLLDGLNVLKYAIGQASHYKRQGG